MEDPVKNAEAIKLYAQLARKIAMITEETLDALRREVENTDVQVKRVNDLSPKPRTEEV